MPTSDSPKPRRPVSLGVIFLTLYIDLIGFSIIFPLAPDLISYYLRHDGQGGLLGSFLARSNAMALALGQNHAFATVLVGGIVFSLYSVLQFIFAPFWGSLSDRHGRHGVLLVSVAGTAVGYLLWAVSGSFWVFILSRVVSGGFAGNLSVVTAAVADVTSREERSKAMGLVGAAFGLGFITGPAVGGICSGINLLARHPSLARFGINPYSVPALLALGFCLLNLFWIATRFRETLPPEARSGAREARVRNPLREILLLDNAEARRANIVAFVYSNAFVAMETCLTYLAAQRFGYTAAQNTILLCFLGGVSIFTQGFLVRRLLRTREEIPVLKGGLVISVVGLLGIGFASQPWMLYVSLAVVSMGFGLVNTSTSGLISLYAKPSEQGRILGIFRSLGSLSRAVTPLLAGIVFWAFSSQAVFVLGAIMALGALGLSVRLPKPVK